MLFFSIFADSAESDWSISKLFNAKKNNRVGKFNSNKQITNHFSEFLIFFTIFIPLFPKAIQNWIVNSWTSSNSPFLCLPHRIFHRQSELNGPSRLVFWRWTSAHSFLTHNAALAGLGPKLPRNSSRTQHIQQKLSSESIQFSWIFSPQFCMPSAAAKSTKFFARALFYCCVCNAAGLRKILCFIVLGWTGEHFLHSLRLCRWRTIGRRKSLFFEWDDWTFGGRL